VSRDDKNTIVIQKWVDIDLVDNHEATFSVSDVELKRVKAVISFHHLQELLDEFNRAKICQGLKGP
jgi:hypothetical protein